MTNLFIFLIYFAFNSRAIILFFLYLTSGKAALEIQRRVIDLKGQIASQTSDQMKKTFMVEADTHSPGAYGENVV